MEMPEGNKKNVGCVCGEREAPRINGCSWRARVRPFRTLQVETLWPLIEGLRDGAAWPKLLDVAGVGKDKNTKRCRILYHPGIGFRKCMLGARAAEWCGVG